MIGARLVRERFRAMGTECEVAVTASHTVSARARRALAAGRAEIESCERALSRFDERSDLSRLNRARGEWVAIDHRLVEALRVALRAREETGGRFDPSILPALVAAGYDRSFEQLDDRPPIRTLGWCAGATVELDAAAGRARLQAGAAVDLGGIGKGFAATRALWAMREAWLELPGALVDLGGDIVVWGLPPEGGPWRVAIADPRSAGARIGTIAIAEGAVATSGRDMRRFGPGGQLHHLIDPATGAPADAGPLAVTVVGPDGAEVEAYATALAVTPPGEAGEILRARPALAALLVTGDGDPVVVGDLPLVAGIQLMEVIA
jgi:thiamine biosynthesis lipoprotein